MPVLRSSYATEGGRSGIQEKGIVSKISGFRLAPVTRVLAGMTNCDTVSEAGITAIQRNFGYLIATFITKSESQRSVESAMSLTLSVKEVPT